MSDAMKSWCRGTVIAAFAEAARTGKAVSVELPVETELQRGLLKDLQATLAEVPDDNPLKPLVSFIGATAAADGQ